MENHRTLPQSNKSEGDLDIQEVEYPSNNIAEWGGEIHTWKPLEIDKWEGEEQRKESNMRPFLVYTTMLLWGGWTLVALITLNPYLIMTSPPMLVLLVIVFRHYFK